MTLHRATPLLESIPLSGASGRRVFLKMENMQPSGSFKLRGVGHLCETAAREGATRFIAPSGGNAGYAAAWSGRALGIPTTVVVPKTTSEEAKNTITALGAEVVVEGSVWEESNDFALALASKHRGARYVHAFDDPLLWEGHGTMIDEAAEQMDKPDAIVLSVGGGGLLCGVVVGMDRNGWEDVSVVACETEGAASYAAALSAGRVVRLPKISSVATSLGSLAVAPRALEVERTHRIVSHVGTDRSAVNACKRFLDDHRVLVEPACGISLAQVYEGKLPEDARTLLVVVCGGIGISAKKLEDMDRAVF